MEEILFDESFIDNTSAPQEWLDHLTGLGVGDGYEGLHGEMFDLYIKDALENPPSHAIQADYAFDYLQCNPGNYTSGRQGNGVSYIVVHFTGGSRTSAGAAQANCIYFNREEVWASAHYFIDDGWTIWQSVPEEDTAWHAGNWSINTRSVGIEVCSDGAFTEEEIERLHWLVRHLMEKYGVTADRVIRHYDASGKDCPSHYVNWSRWSELHARITGEYCSDSAADVDETDTQNQQAVAETPSDGKLKVDGYFGPLTIRALQHTLGTIEDGYVSGQLKTNMDSIGGRPHTAWLIGSGGSPMVKALQRKVGASVDGYFGPLTCRLLQRHLGTPVDGKIDKPSPMVMELQRRLNASTF